MFFKEVDQLSLQDAGEQLKKVLAFRKRCESEKQVFFKEFKSTEDWKNKFRRDLTRRLFDQISNAANEPAENRLQRPSNVIPKMADAGSGTNAASSLMPVVDFLQELAKGTEPEVLARTESELHSARLYLVGLSFLSWKGTSTDLAGAHEINTLFRLRNVFEPLPLEKTLLQRTVLADRFDVKPGWYWFPPDKNEQLAVVFRAALTDSDSDVRKGAFTLLTKAHIRDDDGTNGLFDPKLATNLPVDVQGAFWKYLESIVNVSDRDRIQALIRAGADTSRAQSLMLIARSAGEPAEVLAEAATMPDSPSQRLLAAFQPLMGKIDHAVLIAAFSSRHDSIREAIAAELFLRQLFDEVRTAAQSDSLEAIRLLEYRDRLRTAVQAGAERPAIPENISLMRRYRLGVERLRGLSHDDLQKKAEWLAPDGPSAYEVLATDHWNDVAAQVREDAATNFERLRHRFIERLVQTAKEYIPDHGVVEPIEVLEPVVRKAIEAQFKPDLDEYLRERYGAAALAGIERHGTAADAPLARKYLRLALDQDLAIRALARVGDESDVPELMLVAARGSDETKIAAAELAYRLSGNPEQLVQAFLQSPDADLVRIALLKMEERNDEALMASAIDLLKRDNASLREVAIEFVTRLLNRDQLLGLIESYVSSHYYYNVVVALDRALYCTCSGEPGARNRAKNSIQAM